jgi:hypothetical protein|tara:strand:- start:186 stop:617 length:432 start_codon:yes stop_codon:yes gene_type:complete
MNTIDQKLDNLLDINNEATKALVDGRIEKTPPVVVDTSDTRAQDRGVDYKYTRNTLYNLVERGQDAIEGILDLAKESEHPRTYEVAGQLIKTVADTSEKLLQIQKQMQDLEGQRGNTQKTTNQLFVGSTAELQKLLKKNDGTS